MAEPLVDGMSRGERIRAVVFFALSLALGDRALTFSDIGPGEALAARLATTIGFFLVVGLAIGYLNRRAWLISGFLAWGYVLAGLTRLGNPSVEDAILVAPLLLALAGGYMGARLRRRRDR